MNGAGIGVAVTKETLGTVTAVVTTFMVGAEMICVYKIVVTGHGTETLLVTGGAEMTDVMTVPD